LRRAFPLVLCYHAASEAWEHALSIAPSRIEAQVKLLQRLRYTGVSAEDSVTRRGRLFHVSFDDAFRSLANVLPALERLRVPLARLAAAQAPSSTVSSSNPPPVGASWALVSRMRIFSASDNSCVLPGFAAALG